MPDPISARRLPLSFDADGMARDLRAIPGDAWVTHFNTGYHDGGWSGVALRAPNGAADHLYPGHTDQEGYRDTPLLGRCPNISAALDRLACPIGAVRLLRLMPDGVIREHRDADLCLEHGLARLHIPITTGTGVEFYLGGALITMGAGECWYLDFDQPHRVQNLGPADRVHLVVDCEANDWLRQTIKDGTPAIPAQGQSAQAAFARFQAAVVEDASLIAELWPMTHRDQFVARVVALGLARGFRFTSEDVVTAMRAGTRGGLRIVA